VTLPRILVLSLVLLSIGTVPAAAGAAVPAELNTVTDTSMTATWGTDAPSDSTVCVGRSADALVCRTVEQDVTLHQATFDGLSAGTRYVYELRSAGRSIPGAAASTGAFTTLTPPSGRHVLDVGILNDTHVGEGCSGTAFNAPLAGTSFPPCFSAERYAARMLEAAVAELNVQRPDLVIVNGDLTDTAKPGELAEVKRILSNLTMPWYVTRGNHDRPGQAGSEACGADRDCFRQVFYPDMPPGRVYRSVAVKGVRFLLLDSSDASGIGDLTDARQNLWLRGELAAHPTERTFVVFHHPVAAVASASQAPPVVFGVTAARGGKDFTDLVGRSPQVRGVLGSHTHRNYVAYATGRAPYVENGTSKEYPGGYAVLRVFEGGWTRSVHRIGTDCAFCRSWVATTRGEYNGDYPMYTLGSLSARNFTAVDDCELDTPPTTIPNDQGGDTQDVRSCRGQTRFSAGDIPPGGGGGGGGGGAGRHAPLRARRRCRTPGQLIHALVTRRAVRSVRVRLRSGRLVRLHVRRGRLRARDLRRVPRTAVVVAIERRRGHTQRYRIDRCAARRLR